MRYREVPGFILLLGYIIVLVALVMRGKGSYAEPLLLYGLSLTIPVTLGYFATQTKDVLQPYLLWFANLFISGIFVVIVSSIDFWLTRGFLANEFDTYYFSIFFYAALYSGLLFAINYNIFKSLPRKFWFLVFFSPLVVYLLTIIPR